MKKLFSGEHYWPILFAVLVGLIVGYAEIIFRKSISFFQWLFYQYGGDEIAQRVMDLPWWYPLITLTAAGIFIGYVTKFFLPGQRPHGVYDVMEANALKSGRINIKTGLVAAFCSAFSIGAGAGVGREGPIVHIGATLGSFISEKFKISGNVREALFACGISSAIAAAFNAPLAGVFFAHEVVLGHYARRMFTLVIISAVSATLVSRSFHGDFPAFILPDHNIVHIHEFLLFILLGILGGLVASLFLLCMKTFTRLSKYIKHIPLKTGIGGFLVGLVAIYSPYVLGTGYDGTNLILAEGIGLFAAMSLLFSRIIASGISIGFGFSGGVFSTALLLGAITGSLFFGILGVFDVEQLSPQSIYAVVGMGAVTASVLNAPIATILIVFEMTANYEMTIGLMIAVSISVLLYRELMHDSFYEWKLKDLGVDVEYGREKKALNAVRIKNIMKKDGIVLPFDAPEKDIVKALIQPETDAVFVENEEHAVKGIITNDAYISKKNANNTKELFAKNFMRPMLVVLNENETLAQAMQAIQISGQKIFAVVEDGSQKVIGTVDEHAISKAYQTALIKLKSQKN